MLVFIFILFILIIFSILDYFVIKFYIWHNKDLFYDLHYALIERELAKDENF